MWLRLQIERKTTASDTRHLEIPGQQIAEQGCRQTMRVDNGCRVNPAAWSLGRTLR